MVPILSDGVGIGVLEAFASERRPWSRLGLARARLFAYQLGLLLEKLATKEAVRRDDHLAETRAALRAIGSIPVGRAQAHKRLSRHPRAISAFARLPGWPAASRSPATPRS